MQRCIDFFFNVVYRIICICTYILFHHVLWYPFYYFFFFYLEFKKIFFKFLGFLYFEFFVRKPKKLIIVIITFIINVFLAIFGTLPVVIFVLFIQRPLIRTFVKWEKANTSMSLTLKNFFFEKGLLLLFFFKKVVKYVRSVYLYIKILNLNFFFHDIFQKRYILYKHFVIIRTIFIKFIILLYLYNYLNMPSIYTLAYILSWQGVQLSSFQEKLIFLNLNLICGDSLSVVSFNKSDFFLVFLQNYIDVPIFFFGGVLFFITVLVSWVFFGYLSLNGLFQLNLVSLFFFWFSLLFYIKPIFVFNKIYNIKLLNWFYINNNTTIDYYFLIDSISFSFILLTITIALFVYIYAFSYFRYEPLVDRFLLFLLSFVISMVFLVSSGNLIMLFLGWELIGLTSFFLINFWTTKTATLKSAFKAFSFNKISDFFLFIFIICVYNIYFTVDIATINNVIYKNTNNFLYFNGFSINSVEFLSFMLLVAAFIKSAQIGGHLWLPDSMEAPVPASALIHSATLVSAGIYLILRFNFLFDYSHNFKIIAPLFGSITAAYGGICAISQTDLKKTLAYSTISHCGFLVVLCSTELNEFVILYLYIHGFFKAILFMCIGNVLRISMNYQDSRRIGGLFKYLPFEYFCSLICVFNLAGLPFTFGFFVKHLLFLNLGDQIYLYYFVLFNSFLGAIFGLFYSYNLLYSIFFDFKKGNKLLYSHINNKKYFSVYYTNTSVASTISILILMLAAYTLIFYLYTNLLSSNFLFSDYVNTIIYSNYYSSVCSNLGFNQNYFYINMVVFFIGLYLFLKKKRKTKYIYLQYKLCFSLTLLSFLFYIIYI